MAEPLKNLYSKQLIESIARDISEVHEAFSEKKFIKTVFESPWKTLELKQRMRKVSQTLGVFLPSNFKSAIEILRTVSDNYSGLEHMLFADFVEIYGIADTTTSFNALEHFTKNSSAEFAIRPFIIKYPEESMKIMTRWSASDDEHVRRLASEGCRPRLPWAMALPQFKQDPQPVLAIILNMLDDHSLYVRRSVANNLNDISKDNPETVINIAQQHYGQSERVNWVLKHACRGLLKQGKPQVMKLFGFSKPDHVEVHALNLSKKVSFGGLLEFDFELSTNQCGLGKLRLEFVIDFVKATGNKAPKIFKISEGNYQEQTRKISKNFSFKPISTRKYYPGTHKLTIVVNGQKTVEQEFELTNQTA